MSLAVPLWRIYQTVRGAYSKKTFFDHFTYLLVTGNYGISVGDKKLRNKSVQPIRKQIILEKYCKRQYALNLSF